MWETIRGYLTFTRKERTGVLFLLVIICILFVLPFFLKPSVGDPDPVAYEKMKNGIRQFESRVDSSKEQTRHKLYSDQIVYLPEKENRNPTPDLHAQLFYFDPNRLHAEEWKRLGLSERLTQIILHYIEKGGRFRKAEDLKKLYGLHLSDYIRLSPYVRIDKANDKAQYRPGRDAGPANIILAANKVDSSFHTIPARVDDGSGFGRRIKKMEITDINLADSSVWSQLPGIGTRLASRIVHFRERLGGFYRVEQVGETYGITDTAFQKIKPFLRLNSISLAQLDINTSSREILQSHPYIRWQLARAIVDYRLQHGNFHSIDDLFQLARIDSVILEKLKPYLIVKP